ncbi:MAG: hypothetical protein QM755_20700 [Luteolibacter sp.]
MDTTNPDSTTKGLKRRHVLLALAAGVGGTAVGLKHFLPAAPSSGSLPAKGTVAGGTSRAVDQATSPADGTAPSPTATFKRDTFVPYANTRFSLSLNDRPATAATLVEISPESRISDGKSDYAAFTLLFAAPATVVSEDGIYRLHHPELGEMDLFLANVGRSTDKHYLEAAFTCKV